MSIIISGASSSGKTTLIKSLKEAHYKIVSEAAENVILNRRMEGRYLPWEIKPNSYSALGFQKEIFKEQENSLFRIPQIRYLGEYILDRSTEDILAYINLFGIKEIPKWWRPTKSYINGRIIVLLLKPLSFDLNGIRNKEFSQIEEYNEIYRIYKEHGYEIIEEERVGTLEERMKIIREIINLANRQSL